MAFNMSYLSVRRSSTLGSGSLDIEIASHRSSSTLYFASSSSTVLLSAAPGLPQSSNLHRLFYVLVNEGCAMIFLLFNSSGVCVEPVEPSVSVMMNL